MDKSVEQLIASANELRDSARFRESAEMLRQALRIDPRRADVHNDLGVLLHMLGKLDEAEQELTEAHRLSPGHVDPPLNLGNLLAAGGRLHEAVASYELVLRIDPKHAVAVNNRTIVLQDMGLVDAAPAEFERALRLSPGDVMVWSNWLMSLTRTSHRHDPAAVFAAHQAFGQRLAKPWAAKFHRPHANDPNPDRPLRVGYVSFDFRRHPVGLFIEPLLANHDRGNFHVACYSTSVETDDLTQRLRASVDEWRDVAALGEIELADRIRADGIDVLVDLSGHTIGHRLLTFAIKPAPVQITCLGYPNTTGLDAIDYRITDAHADPPGTTDALHAEKLIRLPSCGWCYRPPTDALPVAPLPALSTSHITFGSFNGLPKLTDATVRLWSNVLLAIAGSRLILKTRAAIDSVTRELNLDRFIRCGIARDRVELRGGDEPFQDHLKSYNKVDLALDTFPYHGTMTTCEALFMGVPVITLAGRAHVSRVGVSLLHAVGLPQFVVQNEEEFTRIAVQQAEDRAGLSELRALLRSKVLASVLCDEKGYARAMKSAFRDAWRRWCER